MYKFLYTGRGFIPGLPARDLTDEEAEQIGIRKVLKSGAYERVKEKKVKPATVADDKKEGE